MTAPCEGQMAGQVEGVLERGLYKSMSLKLVPADVISLSGCMDHQNASEVSEEVCVGMEEFTVDYRGAKVIAKRPINTIQAGGAFSKSLLHLLDAYQQRRDMEAGEALSEDVHEKFAPTMIGLLLDVQTHLANGGFKQIPLLSTNRNLDLSKEFHLRKPGSKRSRALLIGANYVGTDMPMQGCINDVHRIKQSITKCGFGDTPDSLRILTDDGTTVPPTRDNVIEGLKWLVDGATSQTSLFLLFSGHGRSIPDENGDEDDGMDESILCSDGQVILDDDLKALVVDPLPSGCQLFAVFDSCHSGTMLDLPYVFRGNAATLLAAHEGKGTAKMSRSNPTCFEELLARSRAGFQHMLDGLCCHGMPTE